jgi:hypothetical protein
MKTAGCSLDTPILLAQQILGPVQPPTTLPPAKGLNLNTKKLSLEVINSQR